MPALDSTLRNTLETLIVKARSAAESAAESALKRLAVHERAFYPSMTNEQKVLRRALRAKGRQLGDGLEKSPDTPLDNLIREAAYEHWHQMLFAKFLAENDLLMHPENVPVTLRDCEDLAQEEGDADGWATATRYASIMLPGIFSQERPRPPTPLRPRRPPHVGASHRADSGTHLPRR